jgi:flagellar protein FliJ
LDLLEATKRRKAVELLRERRFEQWRLDLERRETAAVDELAVMRYGRKEDAA